MSASNDRKIREMHAEIERLTAERDALRTMFGTWQGLYRRAINEANGLTNYVEDRPELRSAERRLDAIEAQARAALQQPKEPSNPKALALSDADYWIRSRAAILQAIADRGFMLVSNKDGFCLMEAGKMQAQPKEPSNG